MTSDIAIHSGGTASMNRPFIQYQNGHWSENTFGTGFGSSMMAGLYAIAVSWNGARLGQGNALIYADANAGNYASDFHDITTGNNGTYSATPHWDYPTGWGSPDAANLLSHITIRGPKGILAGTVTAAASGSALSGAVVTAVGPGTSTFPRSTATLADGSYSLVLPVGSFAVTVKRFGYETQTATADITEGDTTTADYALQAAPMAVLNGQITDGSGHGYGLYADIKVNADTPRGFLQVADVWTDPATGNYSVELPKGKVYTLDVAAAFNGYDTTSGTVTLDNDKSANFQLTITRACTAPGFQLVHGFGEDFNGGSFPPSGWTVDTANNGNVVWMLSSDLPGDVGNYTGGIGPAADADADALQGSDSGYDTALVTPPIPVTSLHGATLLEYKANYKAAKTSGFFSITDNFDLDIRANGGAWQTILHWNSSHGGSFSIPGEEVAQDLSQYLPATGTFQLRWHYYGHGLFTPLNGWYAQIDDVATQGCMPVAGGLITGRVYDAASGSGLAPAIVTDDLGQRVVTLDNPADPALLNGTYLYFAPAGKRRLTAAIGNYEPGTAEVTVTDNRIVTRNFPLKAPRFAVAPGSVMLDVVVDHSASTTLAIKNIGNGAGEYRVTAVNMPAPSTAESNANANIPVRRVKGDFSAASTAWLRAHGKLEPQALGPMQSVPYGSAWAGIADLPTALADNTGARDPKTGIVYSVAGYNGTSNGLNVIYAYDPETDAWSLVGHLTELREDPAAAFIDGKLYVVGGYDRRGGAIKTLDIFDPVTGLTTRGADDPVPAAGGPGSAVIGGKWYVVGGNGGCVPLGSCPPTLSALRVYDPTTDSWSRAPDYPHRVSFVACGGIYGKLYCAGGTASGRIYKDGYVFDPSNPNAGWQPIANIPLEGGLWGSAEAVANNELLISGGVTEVSGATAITNEGFAYDPLNNGWSSMPNAPQPVYRGGSACGFFVFGGHTATALISSGARLAGFAQCASSIPWLTVAPARGTLGAAASTEIMLTVDGSGHKKFTTSKAYLQINDGVGVAPVTPITINWKPKTVNLDLSGSVAPDRNVTAGARLTYYITVQNLAETGETASETTLAYEVPGGVTYLGASGVGGMTCTAASGTHGAPASASVAGPTTVSCDIGTIAPNAARLVKFDVQATQAVNPISATFTASAREPDSNAGDNALTLTAAVAPPEPDKPKTDSGGGSFGWLLLLALFGLATFKVVAVGGKRRPGSRGGDY